MFEGHNNDNKGDMVARIENCRTACVTKKSPVAGSWGDKFELAGFIIKKSGNMKGRCYCEDAVSGECVRSISGGYSRYDFIVPTPGMNL